MSVPKRIPVKKSTATWAGPISIRKRSGDVVPFDAGKIREAIRKAHVATREEVLPPGAIDELARRVVRAIPSGHIPTVEQVQDLVEEALIQAGYAKTAKAYILYRAEHAKIRQSETDLMEIYKELTFSYAADADIKRENANIDADTSMGTMLKYGSEGAKYFVDNYILPRDVAAAHINGDIHIHDLDFFSLTTTCCQIDLTKLFEGGFNCGYGYLHEPQDIGSYAALAYTAIQSNQNDQHGGQSVPKFDFDMAPGVRKTYIRSYRQNLQKACELLCAAADASLEPVFAKLTESGLVPTLEPDEGYVQAERELLMQALGCDEKAAESAQRFAQKYSYEETERATYQAMEGLILDLNTMHSRAGAQTPFSSLNYGTDTSPEGRMVIRNMLLAE